MTKIITCAELRTRRLEELQALFRSLEIELLRTEPGTVERTKYSMTNLTPMNARGRPARTPLHTITLEDSRLAGDSGGGPLRHLAWNLLAVDGSAAIWLIHLTAAKAYRQGHPRAAQILIEIADVAEQEWLRNNRRARP